MGLLKWNTFHKKLKSNLDQRITMENVSNLESKIKGLIDQSLTVKPGITGPWQVSGRNEIPWNQRVAIDADYAKRRSIIYDIYIILKTPFAMISKW